ncbi:MAG: hypothetical protein GTN81_10225 [Proteobacteria bacterium]|nr:hypothetical protein [Pseudomonadota bacterium]
MKKNDLEKKLGEKIKIIFKEHCCDRYLLFVGSKGKTGIFYKAKNENEMVELIVLGVVEGLKDEPDSQEFLRTVLLSAVTGDAYGTGWWKRLKKVVDELDRRGQKWFGRA